MAKFVVKAAKNNFIASAVEKPVQIQADQKKSVPSLREVNLQVSEEIPGVIAVYKDLNQPLREVEQKQKVHLLVAVGIFTVLAMGILMGQKFSNTSSRDISLVAPAAKVVAAPASRAETISEHYHYDKSCYFSESGEQICTTTTSQKHR